MHRFGLQRNADASVAHIGLLSLVLALFGPATTAHAVAIDFEGSYKYNNGTANSVALVVNFPNSDGGTNNYAFEVTFDTTTIAGFDVFDAVRDGTNGDFDYTIHNDPGWGNSVASMSYKTDSLAITFVAGNADSLLYWISNDNGVSWSPSDVNAWWNMTSLDNLTLSNNQTLGWVKDNIQWAMNYDTGIYTPTPSFENWNRPVVPTTATPEPSTIMLATIGTLACWGWKRRRTML